MERKNSTSITIVNRNYPPGKGITGESANHLAGFLIDKYQMDVKVVHVDGNYPGGGDSIQPSGAIHKVSSIYNGKQKILRLIGNFIESYRLVKRAKEISNGPIILMTDPPFLNYWASRLIPKEMPFYIWSMDLYPDAFVSSGLSSESNPFYKHYEKVLAKRKPNGVIALGDLQLTYLKDKLGLIDFQSFMVPCGIYEAQKPKAVPKWYTDDSKIYLGYCGNLGEAHSVEFVASIINKLDPERYRFVLSTYGSKSHKLFPMIKNNKVVVKTDFVNRDHLQFIDVHLISLLKNWNHVCVPSKAVSAVCSGGTFIFYGSKDCDNWDMLSNGGWFVDQDLDLNSQVDKVLSSLNRELIEQKKVESKVLSLKLNQELMDNYNSIGKYFSNSKTLVDV